MCFCGQILPREGLLTLKAGANIVENFELSKFLMVCEHSCAEERCVPCCKGGEETFRMTVGLVVCAILRGCPGEWADSRMRGGEMCVGMCQRLGKRSFASLRMTMGAQDDNGCSG